MWADFNDLYSEAYRDGWCMQNGKPATISWLYGYFQSSNLGLDAINYCPFGLGTLAWTEWSAGYLSFIKSYSPE